MQEYLIEPLQFYHFIVKWNIDTIFHANTLATSCTYFQHDNIMSRECVEQNGLWQTTQMSDDIDKDYGIWNDLFFDSVDICERSGNPNYYGPILFGFSIDLFKDPAIQSVKITRYNPTKWDQVDEERRYFKNTEYQNDMIYGILII